MQCQLRTSNSDALMLYSPTQQAHTRDFWQPRTMLPDSPIYFYLSGLPQSLH